MVHTERSGDEVRNVLAARTASAVVQAGTITGGVHHHHHPAPPARPVPRQLPPAPRGFVGRVGHLADLDHALSDGGSGPVVISATGGIGKTWLALTWAHRNLHRFPDGQLVADLCGFCPGAPKPAADVLSDFLEALGVDRDDHPAGPDARAALYRTLTTGKRVLVLLDGAVTADQVVPLLPGGDSCAVLVTSRNFLPSLLTRHGARTAQGDPLTDAEARTLLDAALGDDRTAAADRAVTELVGRCGGFPLALGLIAARVRTHPDLVEDVLEELRDLGLAALDSDDPDASLPAVLSWSLRHLTDGQRTACALLGIAPGPDIDLAAAAGLTGLCTRDTRAALRGLVDASLIRHAPGDRYAMHDLVRAYAATTADHLAEPVRRAALERVVDSYLHTAHTAATLLDPHREPIRPDPPCPGAHVRALPDRPAALAWLDAHHPHLLSAQRTAAGQRRHQAVWHLAWTLTSFHLRRGHRHEALTAWRAAVDAAGHLTAPGPRAQAHRRLGRAHSVLGQHEQAIEHLHLALALAEQHGDAAQRAHTHYALAGAWARQGDDHRALAQVGEALTLFRALGQPVWEARALNTAGWHAARLGDHDTGRAHCRAALVLHRRHHDLDGEAATLESLGWIDHHAGRHHRSVRHYRRALALRRGLGHTEQAADTLDSLGHPWTALGRHAHARAAWREALELYRARGRDDDAARVRRRLDDLEAPTVHFGR
ncbi:MAG: tetratricopeptide repeat protein [Saccharothrix sp.]|nr:tetratricopeptide repeat protein [Saccharothrix sp.]